MHFLLPSGGDFEIPDDWWIEAGMLDFQPRSQTYAVQPNVEQLHVLMPKQEIEPPSRARVLDFGGFQRDRMVAVLKGFAASMSLPAIVLHEQVEPGRPYRVYDGYHRFYASIAAGFPAVPVIFTNIERVMSGG